MLTGAPHEAQNSASAGSAVPQAAHDGPVRALPHEAQNCASSALVVPQDEQTVATTSSFSNGDASPSPSASSYIAGRGQAREPFAPARATTPRAASMTVAATAAQAAP